MTIDFEKDKIENREKETKKAYVGYFSANGELIDYNVSLNNNHHDNSNNSLSLTFLAWVSFILKGTDVNKLDKDLIKCNIYHGLNEIVKMGYDEDFDINYYDIDTFLDILYKEINYLKEIYKYKKPSGYAEFEYKLMLFFEKAYKNRTFFETIGTKISIENPDIVRKQLKNKYKDLDYWDLNDKYQESVKKQLLSYLKDICIEFLGYDSIERFNKNGKPIIIDDNYNILDNPRVITSSYNNINDRFYNYLLMDWTINKANRYKYNENTNMYEIDNSFNYFTSSKEEELKNEIESIKKYVKREDRYKYFR